MNFPFALPQFPAIASCIKYLFLFFMLTGLGLSIAVLPGDIFLCLTLLVIVVALVSYKVEWGLYLAILLVPVASFSAGFYFKESWNFVVGNHLADQISLATPVIIISYVIANIKKLTQTERTSFPNPLLLPVAILLLYAFVSLVWSPVVEHSFFQLCILLVNIMLFHICFNVMCDEKLYKKVLWCFLLTAIVHTVIAVFLYISPDLKGFDHKIIGTFFFLTDFITGAYTIGDKLRRGAPLNTPHETAAFMNMIFPVALGLFLHETNRTKKWILVFIMLLSLTVNHFTMTRASIISAFAMAFFLMIVVKRLRRRFLSFTILYQIATVALFVLLALALNLLFVKGDFEPPRLVVKGEEVSVGGSKAIAPQRIEIWHDGFSRLPDNSFLGLGIGNYKYYSKAPHAHSIYFSFLFDFGLLGVCVGGYIFFLVNKMFLSIHQFQSSFFQVMCVCLWGGAVAYSVHGLVDFEYNAPLLWLYLAMCMATLSLARKELTVKQGENNDELPALTKTA